MQTINGVEFTAERPSNGAHSKKSQQNTPPGTDINPITRLGINGFQMQLNVVEDHLDRYDALVAEFMKQQELILVLRDGWEYHVEALGVQFPDMVIELGEKYRFTVPLISETPYQFSVDEVTVSKTITSNNETWSAGDDGTIIHTNGTVDAVPDIAVTGGPVGTLYTRSSGFNETDTGSGSTNSSVYALIDTMVFAASTIHAWKGTYAQMTLYNQDSLRDTHGKITIQATSLYGGVETTVFEDFMTGTTPEQFTVALSEFAGINESVTFRFYLLTGNASFTAFGTDFQADVEGLRLNSCESPTIHNIADTTKQMDVANELELDMTISINSDGTGSTTYADDFTTTKYLDAQYVSSGITHDAGNDELDIADDGYISYKIDAKYPIVGIPILTTRINITAGAPTIQISNDDATYYDIDVSIVDDVLTSYELDSAANLSMDGESVLYFRIDCAGASTNTCSIKTFSLVVTMITIDAQSPLINIGGANTFKNVQSASSSMNCDVDITHKDRKWAA